MKSPLRILYLEDDPRDAELVQETLAIDGITCHIERVETESDFSASLEQSGFDLILADFTLPSFDGISALKIVRQNWPNLPFIFVSGTLGEEVAIEALKIGATDYVFKTRLSRIVPSVQRALREAGERAGLSKAEEALRRSEAYLAEAQKLSHTGSFGWDVSSGEIYWSQETFRIFGYEPSATPTVELAIERTHPEDKPALLQLIDRAPREMKTFDFEQRLLMPDGSVKHLHVVANSTKNVTGKLEFVGAISDVTAARVAEARIRQDERDLRLILDAATQFIGVLDVDGKVLVVNRACIEFLGFSIEGRVLSEEFCTQIHHPEDVSALWSAVQQAFSQGKSCESEARGLRHDGQYRWYLIRYEPWHDERGQVVRWYVTGTDIDDRKQAEEKVRKENLALREEIDHSLMFEEIVGGSPALQAILARVAKVAPTDSTVLITGETGTGKELFARAIHKRSRRSSRAFVSVNCAAIPSTLIASELFGHEKGAFTGALQRRLGRFELAEGGTIFLDEIGELPAETQIALLRVLQEREFDRVGGNQPIRADVRVIVATNRDLQSAIASGKFRNDLFYRLNVFPIEIPPLRERREDIPTLIEYFVNRYSRKVGKKIRTIEKRTLELLESYAWPGNIRELQNVIERSVIVCETDQFSVDPSWLSFESSTSRQAKQGIEPIAKKSPAQQREAIETALAATAGRVSGPTGAAAQLSMPPSTLESKIRLLKINKFRFKRI
jgi:PAS domain S-box-containing protein